MKHTPGPWRWEDTSGAGLQIFGTVPFKANCVEFTLKDAEQPIYGLNDRPPSLLAYETWIQFAPKEWEEMQTANARLIAAAPDLLEEHKRWSEEFGAALVEALQGDYSLIDRLARELKFDFPGGCPAIRSAAIAKAQGETEGGE